MANPNAVAISDLSVGGKIRYIAKNGTDVFKSEVVSIDKKAKTANVKPTEGPAVGKTLIIPEDRLKRMPGRQPGFSPTATAKVAAPAPKATGKASGKPANGKASAKQEVDEEMDLVSARAEMTDLTEAMRDILERMESLRDFMDNLETEDNDDAEDTVEEEDSVEEESPAPKARGNKRPKRPMHDEDEA